MHGTEDLLAGTLYRTGANSIGDAHSPNAKNASSNDGSLFIALR